MSFDMLVEGFTKCKIRVPSFEGPIKGVMGPSRRSAASPRPGPRGPWAARGAPTAAPPPGPGTIGCAGCGVGVPQGRRGITTPSCAAAGTFLAPAGGHQAAPSRAALFPRSTDYGTLAALGREPAARASRTWAARGAPTAVVATAPHPVLVPFRLCRLRCRRCRKGAGVLHEPYMRRRRHLPRACGGASAAPSRRPARTHGQARRRTGFLAGRRDRDAA